MMTPNVLVDATISTSFTLNGANVEQWNDQGASANHLAQAADGDRPSLAGTTVTWTRAEGDYMLMPAALPSVVAGWYVAMVGELSAEAAVQQVLWTDYGVGASGASLQISAGDVLTISHPGTATLNAEDPVAAGVACREFGYDGTNMKYRVNGGAWTSSAKAAPNAYNGAQKASVGAYFNGVQSAEMSLKYMMIVCGRWPSAAELSSHRTYMLAKFGV
jgi:hypothetical protein